MTSLNKVFLIGNLTKDPQLKYVPSGAAVTDLRIAVNRKYKTQAGDLKEDVCYLNVVVWGKQAVNCQEYLFKGSPILVEGRLQSRSWETEDGEKRSTLEVVADRVQFLGKKKEGVSEEEVVVSDTSADTSVPDAEES